MRKAVSVLLLWESLWRGGLAQAPPSAPQKPPSPSSEPRAAGAEHAPSVMAPGSDVMVFAPGSSIARDYVRGGVVLGRALLRPVLEIGIEGDSNFLTVPRTPGATNGIFGISPGVDLEVPVLRSGFRAIYAPHIRILRIAGLPSSEIAHRLDLDLTTRLRPSLALSLREHATRATFETLELDPAREVLFNPKPFWRNDVAVRADWDVTPRDRVIATFGVNRVDMKGAPDPEDVFFDHTTTTLALTYARRWRPLHTLQMGLELGRTDSRRAENARDPRVNDARLLQGSVTLQSVLTPTLRAHVHLAVRRHRFPRAARGFLGPALAFSVERQLNPRLTLTLSGLRTTLLSAFNPEEGNAFLISSSLAATLSHRLGPRLAWTLGADLQRLTFPVPVGPDSTFAGMPLSDFAGLRRTDHVAGAQAQLVFQWHELLALQIGYVFTQRRSTLAPFSFERSRFKMGLAWGRVIPRTSTSRF